MLGNFMCFIYSLSIYLQFCFKCVSWDVISLLLLQTCTLSHSLFDFQVIEFSRDTLLQRRLPVIWQTHLTELSVWSTKDFVSHLNILKFLEIVSC